MLARPLQRRLLQIAVILGGFVPVLAGLAGVIAGPAMVDWAGNFSVPLDSHYRYLSALLLGIGLGFWSTVPRIEKRGSRFRLLTLIVVCGGLGRMVGVYTMGLPDMPMLCGLGMELIVTPLLALWQYRLSRLR